MNDKLRIGILGMGGMGSRHAGNLLKLEGVELAAICSLPKDDADRFNKNNSTSVPAYDDFDRMLAEVPLDALYVCLPPFAHDGQIEKAARRGIAIFAEKPLALTIARGESIRSAVGDASVKSQMGYHMRFGSAVKALRKLVGAGETGRATLFCANYECNCLHSPWWRDADKCGGQIFEQIIHLYDEGLYFMGDVDSVSGFTANLLHDNVEGYTVEDTSGVVMRFKNGALGSVTGSNCAVPGLWTARWHIVFERMVADFADMNNAVFTWTDGSGRVERVNEDVDAYFAEDEYFVSVLRGENPEFAPISEGFAGIWLVEAATRSAKAGGANIKL